MTDKAKANLERKRCADGHENDDFDTNINFNVNPLDPWGSENGPSEMSNNETTSH